MNYQIDGLPTFINKSFIKHDTMFAGYSSIEFGESTLKCIDRIKIHVACR